MCLGASTSQPSDHQNSNNEEPGGDGSVDMDTTPPPLGIKLTGYRLVFMTTVLSFGTIKTILTYTGLSIAPTTLDWVAGTFLTALLYWIGLYEESNKWKSFFQVDLSPALVYCAKRMLGESEHTYITGSVLTYSPVAAVLLRLSLVLAVFSAGLHVFVSIYPLLPCPSWFWRHARSLLRRRSWCDAVLARNQSI